LCNKENVKELYELAFENRVELLFLKAIEGSDAWSEEYATKYQELSERSRLTEEIGVDCSKVLQAANVKHVIFKSFKPYPATPNDTDVVCLGPEEDYQRGEKALTDSGYKVIGVAPMQTLMYHPSGEGKVSSKKAGGTYYVDFYRGVAVDYYEYMNKWDLIPEMFSQERNGQLVWECKPELELAVVLFHNVFPERTFQLEHFYLTLYACSNPKFSTDHLIKVSKNSHLLFALRYSLSLVEVLHEEAFGTKDSDMTAVLDEIGRSHAAAKRLKKCSYHLTFNFSGLQFWLVFCSKLADGYSRKALLRQIWYMKNPKFFMEAAKAAWVRTFNKEIYEHQ